MPSARRTLIEAINLKLIQSTTKYNTTICELCEDFIENINFEFKDIFILNYNALKATMPFESNDPFCNYESVSSIQYISRENLKILNIELKRHLICFDIPIAPSLENYHRFSKLVESICTTLIHILDYNGNEGIMNMYCDVIILNCLSLYEITEWRLANHYVEWYDMLMQYNGLALKRILELQITASESHVYNYFQSKNSEGRERVMQVLGMNKKLYEEISKYLEH